MAKIFDRKTLLNAIDMQWNDLLPEIKEAFLNDPYFNLHRYIFQACDNIEGDSEFDKPAFVDNSNLRSRSNSIRGKGSINSVVGSYVHTCINNIFFDKFDDIRDDIS